MGTKRSGGLRPQLRGLRCDELCGCDLRPFAEARTRYSPLRLALPPTTAAISRRNSRSAFAKYARRFAKRDQGTGIDTAIGRPNESKTAMPMAPIPG